jgi:SAM-dependent methyltransferase
VATQTKHLDYLSERVSIPFICGTEYGIVFRRKDRYQLRFDFKLCTKCGHVRAANPLSMQAAERFYGTSDYRSMYFPGESARDVLIRKTPKPQTVSPLLKYVQALGVAPGRIVEWGCGGGWNLVPFRDAGWTVSGFDYDKPYISLGREVLGLSLYEIQQENSESEAIHPEVLLLNHVLEHAVDPLSLLLHLRKMCSQSTVFVVGVPLLENIPRWHWRDFFHVAHIHYFSYDSLVAVVRNAGFEIVDSDIKYGLFAMRLADTQLMKWPGRGSALTSAASLLKGFLEPTYRLRIILRSVVKLFGLLPLARRAKTMLHQ